MADFASNMTSVAAVDDSIVLAYDKVFQLANGQAQVLEQVVSIVRDINAKSINLPIYARLADATTALTDKEEGTAVALSDTKVVITPKERGNFTMTTLLANLQTGGMVDLAAATNIGLNAGSSQDALIVAALAASTTASSNILTVDGGAEASMDATDVMSQVFVNKMYNKLARANVPKFGTHYIAIMHDDVIADLRSATGAGSWQDVAKYTSPETAFKNEVGAIAGFRVIAYNKDALISDGGGAGTVDSYASYFVGANAVGKAVSRDITFFAKPHVDVYGRFANIGWFGVFDYAGVDSSAVWKGLTCSSVGLNS